MAAGRQLAQEHARTQKRREFGAFTKCGALPVSGPADKTRREQSPGNRYE